MRWSRLNVTTYQTSFPEAPPVEVTDHRKVDLDRWDVIVASVVGVIVFLLYLRTIAPGLLVDDSGEFQTMTRLLGHTHPTGYEVYTVLGRVFSTVPIGDFATRVSAFSAFMGGVAAGIVYVISRLLRSPKVVAAIPALAFAAAPTVWSQGVIAEVYTPAAAFAGAIIGSLLLWQRSGARRWLIAAGIAGGLSLGVHFSIGLYLPAIIVFVVLVAWSKPEGPFSRKALRNTWLPAIGGAVAGILVAVLVFVAVDLINPPAQYFDAVVAPSESAWDLAPGQIDTVFERLRFDWTAKQFTGLMFTQEGLMGERWDSFTSSVSTEIALPLLLSAVVGTLWLAWRNFKAAALLFVALAVQLVYAFNYDIGDMIYVFYIPAYMLLAILAGAGLAAITDGLGRIPDLPERALRALPIAVGALALIFGVYPTASVNNEYVKQGTTPPYEYEAYPYNDYVASAMHPILTATIIDLPQNAIVFGDWDDLYPKFWVAHVEQGRTDLMFHETYPADDQEGMADSAVRYIVEQSAIRPVFVPERIDELTEAGLTYVPMRVGPTKMLKVVP
ncbi:MAG: hypothetical protein BMS9Abin12_0937 [Acidimicrobiia bacterium]|nr:MAG: hypothetical protein BMS9Abin12_0937 [Acidimicrobiia bacterium]